jgi:hypothetical protein
MMKSETKYALIFFSFFLPVAILIFIYSTRKMEKIESELLLEYPLIVEKDSVHSVVLSIYYPEKFRINPYGRRVVLSGSGKGTILARPDINQLVIGDVIKVGSRLYKEPGSDTIMLQNISGQDTLSYFFKLWNIDYD